MLKTTEEREHLSDEGNDYEMSAILVAHHKPLGAHRLLWGKAGKKFPATCMVGPDWPCLALSFILIWGTTIGIMVGVNPGNGSPLAYVIGTLSLLLVTFFLCGAAFSDPGIILKNKFAPGANKQRDMPPPTDRVTGHLLCEKCLVYRPYQAFHCRDCDACVLELDHHCPWTGHCIGKLNIRYFQAYLVFLFIHVVVVVVLTMLLSLAGKQ